MNRSSSTFTSGGGPKPPRRSGRQTTTSTRLTGIASGAVVKPRQVSRPRAIKSPWASAEGNASKLLPQGWRMRGSNHEVCQRVDAAVYKLLNMMGHREVIEKEMNAVSERLAQVTQRLAPHDAKARTYYKRLASHYNRPPAVNARGNAATWTRNTWNLKLPGGFRGSGANNFENRARAQLASVAGLLQVFDAREPLEHQHAELSKRLSKLTTVLAQLDGQLKDFGTKMKGCLPRRRSPSPFEENLR